MGQFPHHPASARERSSYFAASLGDDEDPFLFVSQGESEDVREASLTDGGEGSWEGLADPYQTVRGCVGQEQ